MQETLQTGLNFAARWIHFKNKRQEKFIPNYNAHIFQTRHLRTCTQHILHINLLQIQSTVAKLHSGKISNVSLNSLNIHHNEKCSNKSCIYETDIRFYAVCQFSRHNQKWFLKTILKLNLSWSYTLPVVLDGCETCTLTLKEEQILRVFEHRVLMKILGPKRDEMTRSWRYSHNEMIF